MRVSRASSRSRDGFTRREPSSPRWIMESAPIPMVYSRTPAAAAISVALSGLRSEEHTSELQSRPHLVCRLLLEKKNKEHKQNLHERTSITTTKHSMS